MAWLAGCLLLMSACQRDTFFCDTPDDCTSSDGGGVCEETGYCSFPDEACESGRRYGDLSPSGLAGTCVPQTQGTDGSEGSSSGPPDPTGATTTLGPTTGGPTTDPSTTDATTTDPTADDESTSTTTGEPPACCNATCSTCGIDCVSEVVTDIPNGESLAVSITGDTLVWGTGFANDLYVVDLPTQEASLLASLPHIATNLATDSEYVYYLSYIAGFVGRVDLVSGSQSILADASNGLTEYDAGFGQIAVDDEFVYFALANTANDAAGGAFWVPKEPGAVAPQRLGTLEAPNGIGADDTHIYVSDAATNGLYRFEKKQGDDEGTLVGPTMFPGPLLVHDDFVYATAGSDLIRFDKAAGTSTVVATADGRLEGITADETHVYITSINANSVTRVSLADAEPPVRIANSPGAWGIATSCEHVYWCENGTLSLVRQPK